MSREVPQLAVNVETRADKSEIILPGCIPGATPYHHSVMEGHALTLEPGSFHHILLLIAGEVRFETDGNEYIFHERVSFVPSPAKSVTIHALTDAQLLEIRWDWKEGDDELAAEYKTHFPLIQIYRNAKQYRDRNKSDKTISRVVIEQRKIPRFCCGSVETYGVDLVKPHDHPMLDQYFFSFPENDMFVLIDGEPIPMKGNELLYIPLGADHGVDIRLGQHCHYMWIDFYPDNDEALKRLDWSHKDTGVHREFTEEQKKGLA